MAQKPFYKLEVLCFGHRIREQEPRPQLDLMGASRSATKHHEKRCCRGTLPQTNMETQIAFFKRTVVLIGTLLGFHVSSRECKSFRAG